MGIQEQISKLMDDYTRLQRENEKLKKTVDSLVKEKFTLYGDGYGFLATDPSGQQVWVNSVSIALQQKDEEIKELEDRLVEAEKGGK
jgi:predicted RNase H-like nuclease (RuvC/YqgF family)